MKRILLQISVFSVVLCMALQVFCQDNKNQVKKKWRWNHKREIDTNYIKEYRNELLISLIGTRKFQHVEISSKDGHDNIRYLPNNPLGLGAGFSYRWLSLDLTMKFPYLTKMYDEKGKTDIFRVRLGYNRPKIWMTTLMQICHGFYQENIQKFDPNWFQYNDAYPLRPDIFNFSWYTSLLYSFNSEKVTYQSALGWEQRQKKSAGTFLLGGSVFANYLTSDSSMIPEAFEDHFSENLHLTEQFNLQYGLNCGYVYIFLITKNIYISLSVYPGLHYQTAHQISPLGGKKDISGDFGSVTEARAVVGYNSDKYYAGVTFNEIGILHFPENTVLTNGYAHMKFFVGRRFSLPDWFGWKRKR